MTIGAVSGFLIIVLAIGLQAWYLREIQHEVRAKWDSVPLQPITDMRTAQLARINRTGADPDTKKNTIPIGEAMKIVAQNKGKLPSTRPSASAR
jgi:hypothetical protein